MDPNYPTSNGNTNMFPGQPQPAVTPPQPEPAPPKKRWPFSKKTTLILGVGLVVVVGLVIAALNMGGSGDKKQPKDNKTGLYIQRPGYEGISEGVGDPLSLISTSKNVVKYNGTDVIQSCSLLTLKDIRDAGMLTEANQLTGVVERTYFDGDSPAKLLNEPSSFLPFENESNYCQYRLEDKNFIEITVYQPDYTPAGAVDYEVGRQFSPSTDVEGIKTFKKTKQNESFPNEATYYLRDANVDVKLRVSTPEKKNNEAVLKLLAQHLIKARSTPTPLERFEHKSPIFEGAAVNACDLIDNAYFKAIHGIDSSPFVNEKASGGVGVIGEATYYNYVSHDCQRRAPDGEVSTNTVNVKVTTYENADGAKDMFNYEREQSPFTKDSQPISPMIGDDAYFASIASMNNAITFRKGRVVVSANYYSVPGDSKLTAAQRIEKLTPLLQAMIDKQLKDY